MIVPFSKLKTVSFFISILLLSLPTFAIEEGFYGGGTIYLSVLKKNNYVQAHFIDLGDKYWETFSGYENSDGTVEIISYNPDNNARWQISATESGVLAERGDCLGDCEDGNSELYFDLLYPDTGGISGIYQSLAFQRYIIHQVGKKLIGIDLFKGFDRDDYGFELVRWDMVNESTYELTRTIYSTFGDSPFEAVVLAAFSGAANERGKVTLQDCVITDSSQPLTCEEFERVLAFDRVF
jgi:hypothetical protein